MKKLTIASLMTILILGMVYLSVGQVPSILPISPVTESIVFQKDVTVDRTLTVKTTLISSGSSVFTTGAFSGAIETNYGEETGELGINLNSITSTYSTICQSDAEGIASNSDTRLGLDPTLRTFNLLDRGDIASDLGNVAASHPTMRIWTADASDSLFMFHDGTDVYVKTDDGSIIFQTDEATNTNTYVEIKPKGTSDYSYLKLHDTNSTEAQIFAEANRGFVTSGSGALGLQKTVVQDILCWEGIASGNPSLVLYGYNTAGSDLESAELTMDDTNDEFLIQAANSANHEGVTVSLQEANQQFRIRGGNGLSLYDTTTPATYSTIVQSAAEGVANKSDLRIGLDETLRSLILCDRGDIATDFGLTTANHPTLYLYDAAHSTYSSLMFQTLACSAGTFYFSMGNKAVFTNKADLDTGHRFNFKTQTNIELTDTNAEQAFMYFEPKINQPDTAWYVGFLMDVTETQTGSGVNELMALRVATVDKFTVDNKGYAKSGTLSGSLADNATFATTIPDSWTGIVIVQNVTDTTSGVYHLDGTAITAINQNAAFTVTQGTNDKTNVYIAGNVLMVENTWAAAKTVRVMFIGT